MERIDKNIASKGIRNLESGPNTKRSKVPGMANAKNIEEPDITPATKKTTGNSKTGGE